MSKLDHFKQTMRTLCTEVENLQIENLVYFDVILEGSFISRSDLEERVANALLDPNRRIEVHEMYSEMWAAVQDGGVDAFFEDLLKDLPPTDKTN